MSCNPFEQKAVNKNILTLPEKAIDIITMVFNCDISDIENVFYLKKGMTNHSVRFTVNSKKYIMRLPGEGTSQLINRAQEEEVYNAIYGLNLCDNPIYINAENGYKITEFLDDVRVCDVNNESDLNRCMKKLRVLHNAKVTVSHTFDVFERINYYESLRGNNGSIYTDYETTKANCLSLKPYIDSIEKDFCLTHIDAVPDNFLFYNKNGEELLQLTDWEYSGMQDPHLDIAMFCIYSLYDKEQCDRLINIYFNNNCEESIRTKIYCYISLCGLLWSNWCEYKRLFGVDFEDYSNKQYKYAIDFYNLAINRIKEEE